MVDRPIPQPDDVSRPFWQAAAEHRLVVQRCRDCDCLQHPPEFTCGRCHSDDLTFDEVSGRGTLYSFAIVDRPLYAGFEALLPYIVGLVELDEDPTVRLTANLLDVETGTVEIGMRVAVTFEHIREAVLPQFRPVPA